MHFQSQTEIEVKEIYEASKRQLVVDCRRLGDQQQWYVCTMSVWAPQTTLLFVAVLVEPSLTVAKDAKASAHGRVYSSSVSASELSSVSPPLSVSEKFVCQ